LLDPNAQKSVWRGHYAFRRGIAALTTAAKGLLRHSSAHTTLNHYIKDVPQATENAMNLVEERFKPGSGETFQQ